MVEFLQVSFPAPDLLLGFLCNMVEVVAYWLVRQPLNLGLAGFSGLGIGEVHSVADRGHRGFTD